MKVSSLLDADEFRPLTAQERDTFDSLMEAETALTGTIPAPMLDEAIRQVYSAELAGSFHVAVMTKRLAHLTPTVPYSPFVLLFFAMSADRVGVAVMWSYTMLDYYRRLGRPMMLADFSKAFPEGLPTEAAMHRLWDAQKLDADGQFGDNRIDAPGAWAVEA